MEARKALTEQPMQERSSIIASFGPELAQLLVVTLWASTFIVTKRAFDEVTPLAFAFVRFTLMTLLAFVVLTVRSRGHLPTIARSDLLRLGAAGLTGYTLYQLGFVLGLDRTSPFSSSLFIAMTPLFTMLILAVKRERIPPYGWAGVGVALIGVVIFLSNQLGAPENLIGDALSVGAAISFALYGVVNRPLVRKYPPEAYSAYALLAGSIPLLLIGAPETLAQNWGAISLRAWVEIIYMVALPVYVAYMLWNWAIARRGVAAASSFSLLVPIVSGLLSALFFGEQFGLAKLIGALLVLAGLVLLRFRARTAEDGGRTIDDGR